jgi:hypothetical protein
MVPTKSVAAKKRMVSPPNKTSYKIINLIVNVLLSDLTIVSVNALLASISMLVT